MDVDKRSVIDLTRAITSHTKALHEHTRARIDMHKEMKKAAERADQPSKNIFEKSVYEDGITYGEATKTPVVEGEYLLKVRPGDHLETGIKHDDDTMMKVAESLRENGIERHMIPDIISSMQNKGILFRERA